MKQHAPATERNREAIHDVLARHLPPRGRVLEIASGSGEHAVYFARRFPAIEWQPSDGDPAAIASIAAWRDEAALDNLLAPIALDVASRPSTSWPSADVIVCINMVHISPWSAALALFAGAERTLAVGGLLYLYGPYRFGGTTAPSNEAFDRSLRARDPRWGVRDVDDLEAAARGFALVETIAMPANNHSLLFRRQ